jgi:hypothetical protein
MALSAAVNFLFAKDPKPLDNRAQESPNNQLSDRQNQVRALQRVEDIYGTVRSIPSVLMPAYNKYINHKKVEYGFYCVGRGYYEITDVREGDTPLADIAGASAAIYAPFTSPNSGSPQALIGDAIIDTILSVSRSSAVDGLVLKAYNQLQLPGSAPYVFAGAGGAGNGEVPPASLDVIYQPVSERKPNVAAIAENGQTITVVMANKAVTRAAAPTVTVDVDAANKRYILSGSGSGGFFDGLVGGTTITVSGGFAEASNIGAKTVVAFTGSTVDVAEALVDEVDVGDFSVGMTINYSGPRTISTVQNGYLTLEGPSKYSSQFYELIDAQVEVANGATVWTDWQTLPDTDRTEVWTNVLARSGMYKDDGAKSEASVAYEVQVEQLTAMLVPTGNVEVYSGFLTGATSNERAETLEHVTGWVGPARVRMRRLTDFDYSFQGAVVDEIQWFDLYSVSPTTKPHFGNKTTIHTVTRSTAGTTSIQRRELNCLASRKLPIYDSGTFTGAFNSDGLLVSGTIAATSRIVDIIPAVTIDPMIGNRPIGDLDMDQIWSVQAQLAAWHPECGQFNYTFDSDSLSFEETVAAIANAAFCVPYRQNGKIRLALDRPQATSVALFTHRNKKPRAETITRTFSSEAEYDGVELVYVDPETEDQETIRLPLDGSYTKLKKVEITGIRSFVQAWFRANREYYRLRSARMTIETECTTDARAILPNSRVDIVDNTRFKSWDGEVVAQSGLTLTLSREVEFLPSEPHSIILMKRDGTLQSIACTAGPRANQVILAGPPAEAVVTEQTPEGGIRTIFSFAADSARAAQAWLVQEIGHTDGQYLRIRAVNYSDNYYTADALAVPAKASVIN